MSRGGAREGAGRPRLPMEEKLRRGTFEAARESRRTALAVAPSPVPDALVSVRDYLGIASKYVDDVLAGRIVACEWVKRACARQKADLAREDWTYVWDEDEAIAACHFAESCPHVEGRWPTPLIILEPWQVFVIATLFGWRWTYARDRRRFTTFYLEVARKSAKSTLCAILALYHLLRENEPGAAVVCGATTGQQARVVFGIMQRMVRKSPWLRGQGLTVLANSILSEDGDAKPVNAKASTQDGLNPSCIVLDESHAQDFGLHDVLKSAQGARANPLMLCPTTAGYDLLSVGYALRGQLTKVLNEIFEADHLFGVIYTIDEGDDWRDERAWSKAMPMIGISPTLDYVRRYAQDAQQAPGLEGEFRVKICNLWANGASAWLSMTAWDRCADPTLKLEDFHGKPCYLAADLAEVDDLTALALLFERDQDLVVFIRCYLPEDVVEERAHRVPEYREWVKSGLLVKTEGNLTDLDRVEHDIREACQQFVVKQIVFDRFGSPQLAAKLEKDGLPAIIERKNAETFTQPMRELNARIKAGRFKHDGNSLFRWAASNVVVTPKIDGSLLAKKESAESPNKIDPMDAAIQAIGAKLRNQAAPEKQYQILIVGGRKTA